MYVEREAPVKESRVIVARFATGKPLRCEPAPVCRLGELTHIRPRATTHNTDCLPDAEANEPQPQYMLLSWSFILFSPGQLIGRILIPNEILFLACTNEVWLGIRIYVYQARACMLCEDLECRFRVEGAGFRV